MIHPNWARERDGITDGYSLEMTAKAVAALQDAAPLIPADTPLSITFLPGEDPAARIAATIAVRHLGFEPMPHFSARRILSEDDFEGYLHAVVGKAGVSRCFIVAGDPAAAMGPYADTPVRIGNPRPASIKSLLRFAARCGVGASTTVMKKYGVSITNLLGSAGPERLVNQFANGLTAQHGLIRMHFYPFGGLVKSGGVGQKL